MHITQDAEYAYASDYPIRHLPLLCGISETSKKHLTENGYF